jgi:phospholipid/cholesterol/gamma-HCH transport system substrate-binding protein
MIARRTIINLVTFFALAALGITYGFTTLEPDLFTHLHRVSVVLPDTGGLKPGFSVTMRGVPIGNVSNLALVPNGVRVTMVIQPGTSVPGDVAARVQRANPLGEQQLDLVPQHGGTAPQLPDGATIPTATDPVPPAVGDVVDAANRLFNTIPTQDLATLIHETAVALNGRSQDLRTIIESIDTFSQTFVDHEQGFRSLLANAPAVLSTVAAVGPQLQQALANTAVLTEILARRRNDLVNLYRQGANLADLTTQLLDDQGANLSCLVHDLADLGSNLATAPNLGNLDSTLLNNTSFFGPIDALTPEGPAAALGSAPGKPDQTWFRVRTLLPPAQPPAVAYATPHHLPPTKPGGACVNALGRGVGPASQAHPEPPGPGGVVIPAPAPAAPSAVGRPSVMPAGLASARRALPAGPAARTHPEVTMFVLIGLAATALYRRPRTAAVGGVARVQDVSG